MRSDIKEIKKDVSDLRTNDQLRGQKITAIEKVADEYLEQEKSNRELLNDIRFKLELLKPLKGL